MDNIEISASPEEKNRQEKSPLSFFHSNNEAMKPLLEPNIRKGSIVNDVKVRKLYLQASAQQWFAPQKIHFENPIDMPDEQKRVWIRLMHVFYTLEKMGLNVINTMTPKAVRRLGSEEVAYYLSVQTNDEARHVFTIESYLKKLGAVPQYDWTLKALERASYLGIYRVENWLFSTLFSENFASVFLRRARMAQIDPVGAEMCKYLQLDESRHLHFLHIVLPDIMDSLSLFGKGYVRMAQRFIMQFTERAARSMEKEASLVGINRRDLMEEVFENVEKAYEGFGVTRKFLHFPKIGAQYSS